MAVKHVAGTLSNSLIYIGTFLHDSIFFIQSSTHTHKQKFRKTEQKKQELTAVLDTLSPVTEINSVSDTRIGVSVQLRTSTALVQPAMTDVCDTVSERSSVNCTDGDSRVAGSEGGG